MPSKKIPFFLIIICLFLAGISAYLLFQFKKEEARVNKTSEQELNKSVFKDNLGRETELGVTVKTDKSENKYISLVGILDKVYNKNDRYYLDVITQVRGKSYKVTVDLADSGYTFAEKTIVLEKDGEDKPGGFAFNYNNITSKDVFEKYKDFVGKSILLELHVIINDKEDSAHPCLEVCQAQKAELGKYKELNNNLISFTLDETIPKDIGNENIDTDFIVGSVRLVSIGS